MAAPNMAHPVSVIRVLFLAGAILGPGAKAFLATPLNYTDPDIINVLCPDQMVGETRDHKWITREGIRKNIHKFFLDYPPPGQPDFSVSTKASLTELYHAYYGEAASPTRFIKAVNRIAASNVKADSYRQLRYDPAIQADAEDLPNLQQKLAQRYPQTLTSINEDEAYPEARMFLGRSLHSIQKFYAHSTWIEQGHHDILEELGLPGFAFSNLAGPDEDVCTPCNSAQGSCSNNVIHNAGLSTGYYTYMASDAGDFLVPKPTTGGKCSHGGILDDTADEAPKGGVNKDTSSPCFSPHSKLHQQAVDLAVKATSHYLSVVLDGVGPENYRKLFDLYHGSALSIVIDTTGSMTDSIQAVQKQVADIVNNTATEIYILVEYKDPEVGPILKTEDADEFLAAVNALTAGGGGDEPEMFWQALQLALVNTPDYGDIFCFTDASGKDGDIMEGTIALAEERHTKVSIIYSGPMTRTDESIAEQRSSIETNPQASLRIITSVPEYERLADSTGGLFIPSDKFSLDDIAPILGEGVESTDVDIIILKDLSSTQKISIAIDNSIFDFEIRISGDITTALLRDFTGTEYDIMDQSGLESTENVEVIAYTTTLKAIKWKSPRFGIWNLETDASGDYSINVHANSTLAWLGDFSILDPSPPHPHYKPVEGRPLTEIIYYLEVTLLGYLESKVSSVNKVQYVNKNGDLLNTLHYDGDIDDTFYMRSDPLPETPFYIKLWGHLSSGKQFERLNSVLMTPVQASVEVLATSEDLSAKPGDSATGDFLVTNNGLESDFTITCTDELKFYDSLSPSTIHLKSKDSGTVTVTFRVPSNAKEGSVSTVTVTAQSQKQTSSVNSAVTQFVVLSEVTDVTSPSCSLTTDPDCTGYNLNGICNQKNWTITALLQDDSSGLASVRADPVIDTSVSDFNPGETDPVTLTAFASCCQSQVDIIGVDMQGNIGKCIIDMGKLGGLIYDLEVESVGTTWVALTWHISSSEYQVLKYTLLINDFISQEFVCNELTCHTNVTYLSECSLQTFELTPHFLVDSKDQAGLPASTEATTLDIEPGPPTNGQQVGGTPTTADIEWDATNTKCFSQFRVCYRPFGWEAETVCEQTSATNYKLRGLEACAIYRVEITTLSSSGIPSSDILQFHVNAGEAVPGSPRAMTVDVATLDTVEITWNNPKNNPFCVDKFLISYGEEGTKNMETAIFYNNGQTNSNLKEKDHHATISDLTPCTNYTIDVAAQSVSGLVGPGVRKPAATDETEPLPPTSVISENAPGNSASISWDPATICVDHFHVCYYENFDTFEICLDVWNNTITLHDLLSCSRYTVFVSSVTPKGILSNQSNDDFNTHDAKPGEPENFTILKETPHSVDFIYDPPSVNPQCAVEYDFKEINLDQSLVKTVSSVPQPRIEGIFKNLDACTNYELQIRAVSVTNLYSNWVSKTVLTTEDNPSEPRNFTASQHGTHNLDLVWWLPKINSMCVSRYIIDWFGDTGDSGSETINPPSPDTPLPFEVKYTLKNLVECSQYNLTVHAITLTGGKGVDAIAIGQTGC